ncbi:hypothetical protein [Leptospira borgpetersenii]|nr:hypothetical protein [Leptospira borgpetersenii]
MSLSQNVGTIVAIREDSDKIEWFWDTLFIFIENTNPDHSRFLDDFH